MTDLDITELRKLAENATPGPWEYGVRWHIQGATHCQCREQYGPLLETRRMNINGQMMDAHIHKRENPWDENGILTGYVEDGHPTHVVIEMEEYGTMSQGDGEYIAAFNPETVKALLDRLERAEAAIERVREQPFGKDHYEPVDPGFPPYTWAMQKSGKRCDVCEETWPCPTVAALDTGTEKNG